MYDDIAKNKENPRPGVIINSPHGEDVYNGVPKVLFGFVSILAAVLRPLNYNETIYTEDLLVAGLHWR